LRKIVETTIATPNIQNNFSNCGNCNQPMNNNKSIDAEIYYKKTTTHHKRQDTKIVLSNTINHNNQNNTINRSFSDSVNYSGTYKLKVNF
jgi:hypothetical protein